MFSKLNESGIPTGERTMAVMFHCLSVVMIL